MRVTLGRTPTIRANRTVRARSLPPIKLGSSGDPIYIADAVVSGVVIGLVFTAIERTAGLKL